ncbi:PilN domain-containing protein [Spongiibacter sp. KMU-158]|uniref:PilN domain-containing protein n=1 Tax=Spongiibacter pelagi TaxID=2760804 RepID=A0A927GUU5_9GAMM|nr:PilN domain-containing protein [Spongiibacter pelagi]MBD2857971.1 PilN domain-containing protein [Spongiibacter pelagi]
MATINLLPWREERRQQIKTEFLVILGAVVVLGAVIALIVMSAYNSAISSQEARNAYIQQHIEVINREVAEIKDLEQRRQQLLDRMSIIQSLQGERPLIVRVFDEMVRTLPDGLFYTRIDRSDKRINAEGVAESNNRISSLMRKLDTSPWFDNPNLADVKAADILGDQASSFKLSYSISAPAPDEDK